VLAVGHTDLEATIDAMTRTLNHRGPDDRGRWVAPENGVALGHTRLSILDLSPEGHQPMLSASGRFVIVFNGEIYNFAELRARLETERVAPSWRGHSDTEILLAAIEAWGLRSSLERSVGMFALAVWDRETRELWLARDRMGEKPLYYGTASGAFLFASELKAIRAAAPGGLGIDRDALADFMRFGCVPAPRTIYRGIRKLPPGAMVRVMGSGQALAPQRYWTLDSAEVEGLSQELAGVGDDQLLAHFEQRLSRAVVQEMVADVPLGAFLSGGVDSSLIVALMQAHSSRPVRTFTIGFAESGFDEAPFAREVAKHLGTDHTELYVTPDHAAAIIPRLPHIYDEPFADSSQVPTALVAQLTRAHVTVSLSGDGGDELFAGYPRYGFAPQLWKRLQIMPRMARLALARGIAAVSPQRWDSLLSPLPALRARGVSGHRMSRLAQLLAAESFGEMYVRLISQWQPEDRVVLGAEASGSGAHPWPSRGSDLQRMRRWDAAQYLPDDILVKVDRAAMSASLESRAPLLDHRVVEFAFSLPENALVRNGESKWLMRQLLDRYVPRALIDRPKSGFGLPLADWLRGPLRDWAEELLDSKSIAEQGLLDSRVVSRIWRDHLAKRAERHPHLWNVLMFQAWAKETGASDGVSPTRTAMNSGAYA
jgi:asparagine synthase (glutamine-hydrolysing)